MPLDANALYSWREPFGADVQMGACPLTAGADVQGDRIEVEIAAWGDGEELWSVAYLVLYGDTGQPDVWCDLDRLLIRRWHHESGLKLPVTAACVTPDSRWRKCSNSAGRG